jgi:hypothetical protein
MKGFQYFYFKVIIVNNKKQHSIPKKKSINVIIPGASSKYGACRPGPHTHSKKSYGADFSRGLPIVSTLRTVKSGNFHKKAAQVPVNVSYRTSRV